MSLIKWFEKVIKKMKWYDISLTKLAVFLFTIFLVTVWPGFRNFILSFEWYWSLILFVVVMIPLSKKLFFD